MFSFLMLFRFIILPPRHPQYDENFLNRSKMTSRKQLVACPKNYLAANNEAEEDFNENVACAVQTITTQEDGFLSQDQRNMLVLSAMLIGAPVHHGHQPILVSLSILYVDTKQIMNGMDNNNQATEESQAIDLLDSNIAESCLSGVYEGLQNTEVNKEIQNMKQLKNGMDNNNQATEESQASDLRLDSNLAESCSLESEGSQKAAAHPAFSPFVPVVSRSMLQTRMRKKRIFFHILGKYIC